VFSGRIDDAQGKFNLRNLAQQGTVQAESLESLQRLLALLGQPQEAAGSIARRVAIAQHELSPEGQALRAPLAPMPTTPDDLLNLDGVPPSALDALRPYIAILPDITPVNANTAPAEVLAAVVPGLSLAQARAITRQRDQGAWFNDLADFA